MEIGDTNSGYQLQISGMTCGHCVEKIKGILKNLYGTPDDTPEIEVSLESRLARVNSDLWLSPASVNQAFRDSGYKVEDISYSGTLKMPVYGMHCGNCVERVKSALSQLKGVTRANVNLEPGQVTLSGSGSFSLNAVVNTIEQEGYTADAAPVPESSTPVPKSSTTVNDIVSETGNDAGNETENGPHSVFLAIEGMTCASCVATVEKALSNVPSVTRASVNFADETAWVESSGSEEALLAAVKSAGYGARLLEEQQTAVSDELLRKRLIQAFIKSFIALLAGALLMTGHKLNILPSLTEQGFWLTAGLVTLTIMLATGRHFYISAYRSALKAKATMDTLVALGTGIAWLYSMVIVLKPSLVPTPFVYFEAALFIIGLVNLGKALENNAKNRTAAAIRSLLAIQPSTARVIRNDVEIEVDIDDLNVGDQVRVRPGETIPVDGVLIEGETSIDEAMLTGEPEPIEKGLGESVSAGTINQFGTFVMTAQRVGANTNLARIVEAVKQAQNSKPAIGRLADRISSWFVPSVIIIALLTALSWWLLGPEPQLSYMLVTSVSVLIIACPCALGLATPLSIMVGMGRSAASGILIRNGDSLQVASQLNTIVFDKTGTLTEGRPAVSSVTGDRKTLEIALGLERLSEHPIASGIVGYCEEKGTQPASVTGFEISPGGGVKGYIDNSLAMVGNRRFIESAGIKVDLDVGDASTTDIYVVHDSKVLGLISLEDKIRADAFPVIEALKALGIRTVMLTGDNSKTAKKVTEQLKLDDFYAEVQPLDKGEVVASIREMGAVVGMVGDGINDSVALTAADVGFAMSDGSDIAIESSDVTLIGNRLSSVVEAIKLSKQTMRNIYQNLFGAFVYNALLIPVAAGILYPFMKLMINPAFAGAAMAMSSITVVMNASRLRFIKI